MTEQDRQSKAGRYNLVAIILHWVTALLIVTTLVIAMRFENLTGAERSDLIRVHKSIGVTILFLSIVRVAWLFTHPPAPLPSRMSRLPAALVHGSFYALLLMLPLSGWAMISAAEPLRATMIWGLIELPAIVGLPALAEPTKTLVHTGLGRTHLVLAGVLVALLFLHVAGAVWHTLRREPGGLGSMLNRR